MDVVNTRRKDRAPMVLEEYPCGWLPWLTAPILPSLLCEEHGNSWTCKSNQNSGQLPSEEHLG